MSLFVIDMETALENSFKNFHAKGMDYLCLRRTDELTEKIYLIADELDGRDVVIPHDHRYDFSQEVLAGKCRNTIFREARGGSTYHRFLYETPLNGGKGFLRDSAVQLSPQSSVVYARGQQWAERAEEIHTITCEAGTALYQRQYRDRIETPTRAYSKTSRLPDVSDLYEHMTEADVFAAAAKLVAAGHTVEIRPE